MRYPSSRKDESRARIVASARKLFNRLGFDAVSVAQIMAEAGLTHGGFYRHFASKSDLYAEVLQCFFTDPGWENSWDGVHVDLAAADIGPQIVRAYLSRQHLLEVDNACPMVALPSDVARAGESAKRAYETVINAMVDMLQKGAGNDTRPARTSALAIAALCVGGMVIAKASHDAAFADELREAAIAAALELGGWDGRSDADPRRSQTPSEPG
jgi:TetR/AcrR family transcriptional regulator, transcriptional repressor for nem operon